MIRIWGRPNSTNVKKVMWTAAECGLAWELVPKGGSYGGLEDPDFRRLNPLGLVPVLEDDGLVLTESNAIVRYLAAEYGGEMLFAYKPRERARSDAWMDWVQTSLLGPLFTLIVGLVRTPAELRDDVAIAAARRRALQLMGQLDEALGAQDYLSGDRLGIGDIAAGCAVHALQALELGTDLPALTGWYRRLLGRPAYREIVAVELS